MTKSLVYSVLSTLLVMSCDFQKTPVKDMGISHPNVSSTYKPPIFTDDNPVDRIKNLTSEIQRIFEEHALNHKIPGIAYGIVVDSTLVIGSATGVINLGTKQPATTKSCFRIASMTKSFVAMGIMKLRDEGKLSLEDPVSKYIPEIASQTYLTSDAPSIKIFNLLTMTSGLPEDNPWGDRQLDKKDDMLNNLISKGLSFSNAPSIQYEYSNTGFALLGRIISNVSGLPYQAYINKYVILPLGMEHTYWEYSNIPENELSLGYRWEDEQWKTEPLLHDGSFGAIGGLITSIEDFGKYVGFHLSAWPPRSDNEYGPIKRSTLREMHTQHFSRLNANSKGLKGEPCPTLSGYGYGLAVNKDCNGKIKVHHSGALPGFCSNYVFFPEYGVGIMAFGNRTYTNPLPNGTIEKLLFETIGIQPRQLPTSDILIKRQKQIVELLQNSNPNLEKEILAENFYLDYSREQRISSIRDILDKAGTISKVGATNPINQLRGNFLMEAENGEIEIFFTLSPEADPKIQYLKASFNPN